jgi:GT2 family glycosyltransferase
MTALTVPDLAGVGLVVIGRNEGERLIRCLASVHAIPHRVYVDSGSSDGSVERARRDGVSVIELEVPPNFTAARARNAGLSRLLAESPTLEFVQMVDGDCEVHPEWIAAALAALRADPGLAAVFGRLRERFPTRSIYNALADDDWDGPLGDAPIFGGVVLIRVGALRQVNFYNPTIIAGEEPDLSMRMRKNGWRLSRINSEMGFHDANITRFAQWRKRTQRTGHAYAELAHLHPDARHPNWPQTTYSIIFWGGLMPLALLCSVLLALLMHPYWWLAAAAVLALWLRNVVQITRRRLRDGLTFKVALASGLAAMIGKPPQLTGLLKYHRDRLLHRSSRLIEYKGPANPQK